MNKIGSSKVGEVPPEAAKILVSIKPTEAMIRAGAAAQANYDSRFEEHNVEEIWDAMLSVLK